MAVEKITYRPKSDYKTATITSALPDGSTLNVSDLFGKSGEYSTDDAVEVTVLDGVSFVERKATTTKKTVTEPTTTGEDA